MAGGACVARKVLFLFHKRSHGWAWGQCAGSRNPGRRCGLTRRAGTVTSWCRRLAPRANARPLNVAAARSRLWAMAAHNAQAEFAAKCPEGRCTSGPSMRSENAVSMTAWPRWVRSASVVGSVLLVKNGGGNARPGIVRLGGCGRGSDARSVWRLPGWGRW